jgi:hypothetical protein
VKRERRYEAYDASWDESAGGDKRMVFGHVGVGQRVETTANPLHLAPAVKTV